MINNFFNQNKINNTEKNDIFIKVRQIFNKYSKQIYSLILFIIAYLIIINILPQERKFRYEIQKGKPWQHEDLIATFDFPIYKLADEIERERDSIEKHIKPYFIYEESVEKQVITRFIRDYEIEWLNYLKQDSVLRANDYNYRMSVPKPKRILFNYYFKELQKILHNVYNRGVYDFFDIQKITSDPSQITLLVIYRDGIAKTYSLSEVYSLKSGYEYLIKNLDKWREKEPKNSYIINFFRNMNLNQYIEPNLRLDQHKTNLLKQSALYSISETIGFVQAGEKIISKGEVVDFKKYRILMSLKKEYEKSNLLGSKNFLFLGNAIVVFILLLTFILFIYNYKPLILSSPKDVSFFLVLLVLNIVLFSYIIRTNIFNIYIFPLAIVPVIVKVFFDERLALYMHLTIVFIIGFYAPNSFEFVILQFVSGYAAIFSLSQLSRRGQLYTSAIAVFLALSILYLGIGLTQEGSLNSLNWKYFIYFGVNVLLLLLAYPLIYIFEKLFGFLSDLSLLELANTNNKLLRELSMKAPGTFHHSLQVANIAEGAANKVNANALLVRVGALYHDIGKLYAPLFFIENQVFGYNPHDKLDFKESAKVILKHVSKGEELAKKYKLPNQIIDFIRTHHGTMVIQYFYKLYIKKYPDKEDDLKDFVYPGPKPFSKEMAILMMADSIEAASRSIKNIDQQKIDSLVDSIIDNQLDSRQFDNSDLTFQQISILRKYFKDILIRLYHARIEYPK